MALTEGFRSKETPAALVAQRPIAMGSIAGAGATPVASAGPMGEVCLPREGRPPLTFEGALVLSVATEGLVVRHRLSLYVTAKHSIVAHLAVVFGAGADARQYSNAVELAVGGGLAPLWRVYDPDHMVPQPRIQAGSSASQELSEAERDDWSVYLAARTAVRDDLAALRADPRLRLV